MLAGERCGVGEGAPLVPVLWPAWLQPGGRCGAWWLSCSWGPATSWRTGVITIANPALTHPLHQRLGWLLFVGGGKMKAKRRLACSVVSSEVCRLYYFYLWAGELIIIIFFSPLPQRCWLFLLAGGPDAFRSLSPDRKGMDWNHTDAVDFLHCFLLNSRAKSQEGTYRAMGPVCSMQFLRFTACLLTV